MDIIKLEKETHIKQVASILYEHFENWITSYEKAIGVIKETISVERISLVAIDNENKAIGWVAGIHNYPAAWELHPLVVAKEYRYKGIGSKLMQSFENEVGNRNGRVIYLGTDDEDGLTSIYGKELFPDVLGKLKNIENINNHPFEFYLKNGFEITGIIPDANGFGKPDIIMCKKVVM